MSVVVFCVSFCDSFLVFHTQQNERAGPKKKGKEENREARAKRGKKAFPRANTRVPRQQSEDEKAERKKTRHNPLSLLLLPSVHGHVRPHRLEDGLVRPARRARAARGERELDGGRVELFGRVALGGGRGHGGRLDAVEGGGADAGAGRHLGVQLKRGGGIW